MLALWGLQLAGVVLILVGSIMHDRAIGGAAPARKSEAWASTLFVLGVSIAGISAIAFPIWGSGTLSWGSPLVGFGIIAFGSAYTRYRVAQRLTESDGTETGRATHWSVWTMFALSFVYLAVGVLGHFKLS